MTLLLQPDYDYDDSRSKVAWTAWEEFLYLVAGVVVFGIWLYVTTLEDTGSRDEAWQEAVRSTKEGFGWAINVLAWPFHAAILSLYGCGYVWGLIRRIVSRAGHQKLKE